MRQDVQERAEGAAFRRGGVLRTCDLAAAGVSPDAAERAVARNDWQRPARGIYVPHARPLGPLDLGPAAAAYVGGPYLLTGLLVLHLLGCRWLPELSVAHVLVPDRCRRTSSKNVLVTRVGDWEALTRSVRFGLHLAGTSRAVVDAARALDNLRDVRGVVLAAVADRRTCASDLAAIVEAGRRNGSALVRRAVRDAARGCASPPEAELVDALVGCGRPFLVNPELWYGEVLLGCPDVWLVNERVGGEVESVERHEGEDGRESTYDRHERFAAAGAGLVHLSVRRIRRDAVASARHFLDRATAIAPAPSGLRVVARGPVLR